MGAIEDLSPYISYLFMGGLYAIFGLVLLSIAYSKIINPVENFIRKIGIEFKWMREKRERDELIIDTANKLQELKDQRAVDVEQSINHDKKLQESVGSVICLLEKHIESEDKRTVAILRSTLYKFHSEFMSQGYVTSDGLKTFDECGRVYEEAGGNDIFHDKLKPEVMSLPIKNN